MYGLGTEIEVRPYNSDDEEKIVELLELAFEGWPRFSLECTPLEHWRWRYKDNLSKMNFTAVVVNKDRIIGTEHAIPINIKIGDRNFLCAFTGDTAVHPDFRRRGISKKVIKESIFLRKLQGVQFSYFVTGNTIFIKSFSRTYLRFPHTITNFVRIRDINLQLRKIPVKNAFLMKLGFHTVKYLNKYHIFFNVSKPIPKNLRISKIGSFDDRIEEFWQIVSENHRFIIKRSRDYLNWRYCDPRAGDFTVRQAEKNGRILGYIILKINRYRKDYPIGFVVDLLTLPRQIDVADALMADAVRYFDNQNINIVNSLAVKNHPYEKVLMKHGFLDSRINLHLFYDSYREVDEIGKLKIITADKIHFSYGDIDSLPISMPSYK